MGEVEGPGTMAQPDAPKMRQPKESGDSLRFSAHAAQTHTVLRAGNSGVSFQSKENLGFAIIVPSPLFTKFLVPLQDVDCLYLTKEELEVRVGLLRQQLEFLKCIYAEVRAPAAICSLGWASSPALPTHPYTKREKSFLKILEVQPRSICLLDVFDNNSVTPTLGRQRWL